MTPIEPMKELYQYQRSLKDTTADRLQIHKGTDGSTHIDYGEWVSVVATLGDIRGTWSVPATSFDAKTMTVNESHIHGETFFTVYWVGGAEVDPFQIIVYANSDERSFWRGVRICQQQPEEKLHFKTAKAAFQAITEQGFNRMMITYPHSVNDELNRLLKNHRQLGKKTTNRIKKSAY
jgi:hypothetical protein